MLRFLSSQVVLPQHLDITRRRGGFDGGRASDQKRGQSQEDSHKAESIPESRTFEVDLACVSVRILKENIMDFGWSKDSEERVRVVREFVRKNCVPLEAAIRTHGFKENLTDLEALRDEARKTGLFAPHVSKEHGGSGLSLMEFAPISEELGQSPIGHYVFNCQAPDAGNMELLAEFGSEDQQKRWLKPLVAGKIRSCFAMTEPEFAGSNPVQMGTRAQKDGDSWVINGHKWFTTAADGAAFTIVMAQTSDSEHPYARASQIIVPLDSPGFRIERNISVMGESGDDYNSHAEVRFEDVRVPLENLIGGEGAGFAMAQERLGPGRIHHCMRWIGICERAFDLMCQRAATREISEGKPLATRQIVQSWIAESRAEINASRLMVLQAAWKIDSVGARAARVEISTIKFYVAGVLQRVLDRAIQTHGALGITDDTPLAWWYRHERGARIYDGPDEVHKVLVAREALKPYGVKIR